MTVARGTSLGWDEPPESRLQSEWEAMDVAICTVHFRLCCEGQQRDGGITVFVFFVVRVCCACGGVCL